MSELAYSSFNRSILNIRIPRTFTQNNVSNNKREGIAAAKIHPTQKPIQLYSWLLTKFAEPGMKILDTHMGSQSSRIATFQMGFDYYGWEIDKDYFDDGNKRFKEQTMQQSLFKPI